MSSRPTPDAAQVPVDERDPPVQSENRAAARTLLLNAVPSWLASMVVHVALLMILALVTFGPRAESLIQEFTMNHDRDEPDKLEPDFVPIEFEKLESAIQKVEAADFASASEIEIDTPDPAVTLNDDLHHSTVATIEPFDPLGEHAIPEIVINSDHGDYTGNDLLAGRSAPERRRQQAINGGGGPDTEDAVALALKWIASRQNVKDGGWSFNHNDNPLNPRPCPDPGTADLARNGATGMSLLPFLGAGQTHREGAYRRQVAAGLAFLVRSMKVSGRTGSWHEADGNMYSHGLASIAMCEAYAMTHDKELLAPAQLAVNYIVEAQDPVGGGWRYAPRQAGDTSVVGWQLMALKSGHLAYLAVPKSTIAGVSKFLDSVAADSGAEYGYTGPNAGRAATSSIGLLCRMYLGWKREDPALARGVEIIDKLGPSASDMYYNYYATQVCRHTGGEPWRRWNDRMKGWLVKSQAKEGVTAGSWHMGGGHANDRGGRLYCTALATMMLEVYYRHQPLYRDQAVNDDFPL